MSSSSIDPDIQAAFSGTAPTASSHANVDDDIAQAFAQSDTDKRKTVYDSSRPAIGDSIEQVAHQLVSGAYHSVVGGYKGLRTLAQTRDVDQAADAVRTEESQAYQASPSTAKTVLESPVNPMNWPSIAGPAVGDFAQEHGASPGLATAINAGIQAGPLALGIKGTRMAREAGPMGDVSSNAQEVVNKAHAAQSQGASANAVDVSKLTPETQAEIVRGAAQGQTPNLTALQRIHDAETLPVPMHLMPGQALDNIGMQNAEFNAKGKYPEIGSRFDEQNSALKGSLGEIQREAAPNAVGNNTLQNSQSLIDKLKGIGDTRDAAITDAYTQAKSANGNKLPMDVGSFLNKAKSVTDDPVVSEFLPPSVQRSVIGRVEAKGSMDLDDYLASQKILGRELRKAQNASDGNAIHAIGKVRDALEQTQLAPGASPVAKELYAKASSLVKANYDDLKVNPAYKAAYDDRDITPTGQSSDLNKNFVQKHIIGGTQANLQRLRSMFGGDEEAHQTMTAAALNHLSESANIDPIKKTGNFSNAGFNNAYGYDIAPRAKELLQDPELIDKVEQLGRAAGYSINQKRGTAFNNSHTFVASQADTLPGKVAAGAVKKVPIVGDFAADYLSGKMGEAARKEMLDRILRPGAGLYEH